MARQDWLDNLEIEKPTTLDEYVAMMRAFKNDDPDQNGVDDTYAMTFRESLAYSQGFIRSFEIDSQIEISYDYVDGALVTQQTQQKYKDYLEFMNMLWEEGLFTPNSMTNTSDQWKTEIFTGIAGMWFHQTYRIEEYFMTQFKSVQGEDTTVELTALEPPTGYNGEKSSILNRAVFWGIFINKDAADIESVFNYYMWLFTDDEVREYAKYGIEGTHHTVDAAGNKTIIAEALGNDVYNQWKELVFITSNYPIDSEEASLRYGEIGYENHEMNVQYGAYNAVSFTGKPTLQAEEDYPDINSIVLEYTVKIISGELELDDGFDAMVQELNNNGLEEVTAERQEWYSANVVTK